ncbi:hypothetical protein HMPREF9074_07339 [Capnocytophaga sp. oral taxon 329 str. F0087]|nr:hypothetical protein HMPREF9074_07339 [Capnocytophaga sp. oral taxon 329 str. F0087]
MVLLILIFVYINEMFFKRLELLLFFSGRVGKAEKIEKAGRIRRFEKDF